MNLQILKAIRESIRKGTPLAGLLAGAVAISGCDHDRSEPDGKTETPTACTTNCVEEVDEPPTMGELLPDDDVESEEPSNVGREHRIMVTAGLLMAKPETTEPNGVVSNRIYVVQEGDDLVSVSIQFSMTTQRLRAINPAIVDDSLRPGMKILVEEPVE